MDFTERKFATADGPVIHLRDYPGPERSLLPVICLHGLTRNASDFDTVAARICALGRRVIVPDARGRGNSDNDPDPSRYRPDVYVGDLFGAMDLLGLERAVFVGTSMGGIMTMLAASRAPSRVAGAVLNDIGPVIDPSGVKRIASYVGRSGPFADWQEAVEAIRASQSSCYPGRDDLFWQTFARRVARECGGRVEFAYDPAIAAAFAAPPARPAPDLLSCFAALAHGPVLVIRGETSDILAREGVEVMRRAKPDLEFAEVPATGHAPTLEEAEAWRAISAFLSKVE